jgi:hypothetical protein
MAFGKSILMALAVAGSAFAFNAPASAAPLMNQNTALRSAVQQNGLENVQWRSRGWRGHHGWTRHHGYHGGHYRRGYGWGPAVGGLAAGAIIGGAIANSQARASDAAYCSQRFKSYDPTSGTYLGYDGIRHPCP